MSEKWTRDLDALLQRELEEMAAETPPMTRSFRNGWREAVRREAAAREQIPADRIPADRIPADRIPAEAFAQDAAFTEAAAGAEAPAAPDRTPAEGKAGRIARTRRWTGLLSAAAVLVFLIGGTLLTRGTLSPRLRREAARIRSEEAAEWPDADAALPEDGTETANAVLSEERTAAALSDETANTAGAALPAESFAREAEAPASGFAAPEEEAGNAVLFSMMEEAAEEDAPSEANNAFAPEDIGENPAAAAASTAMPTAAPRPEPTAARKLANGPAAVSGNTAPEPETPSGNGLTDFLEDMGAFVLAALPWLAGAAVICLGIALVRRKRRIEK